MKGRLAARLELLICDLGIPTAEGQSLYLGTDYGGWSIPSEGLEEDAVVYSAGLGEDASFDLELIDRYRCAVWAFDPTPRAITFAGSIDETLFHFLPVGLWSSDGPKAFFPPKDPTHVSHSISNLQGARAPSFEAECLTLASLMERLGHDHIDLLKLDIEGAEYEVLDPIHRGLVLPTVLAVEFHPVSLRGAFETVRRVRRLRKLGYRVIARKGWDITLARRAPPGGSSQPR